MFTSIYKPKKIDNFIGNVSIIQPFIEWLLEWDSMDKKNKCALISGLTGIGKTLLVELILKKFDYNMEKYNQENKKNTKAKSFFNIFILNFK